MAVTGIIGKSSDWYASCENVVDDSLPTDDPNYEIDDATVTLNCYDEDNDDTLVVTNLDLPNPAADNNYYATVPKATTGAMVLGHIIRCEFDIDGGVGKFHKRAGWARVVLPTDNLSE